MLQNNFFILRKLESFVPLHIYNTRILHLAKLQPRLVYCSQFVISRLNTQFHSALVIENDTRYL
jgi:hypothetical protein